MTTEPTPSGARVADRFRRIPRRWIAMISVLTITGAAVAPWAVAQTITSNGVGRRLTGVIQACADRQTGALRLVASGDQVAAAPVGDFCTVNEEPVYWASSLGAGATQPTGPAVTSTGPAVTSTTAPANPTSTAATTTTAGATTSSRPTTTVVGGSPCLASVTVSTPIVYSGGAVRGLVSLRDPAPAGGVVVRMVELSSSVAPFNVSIPAGQVSATFSAPISYSASFGPGTLAADIGPLSQGSCRGSYGYYSFAKRIATPVIETSGDIVPGQTVTGRLRAGSPPGPGSTCNAAKQAETGSPECWSFAGPYEEDFTVTIQPDRTVVAPLSLTIPAGTTSVSFKFTAPNDPGLLRLSVTNDRLTSNALLDVVPLRVIEARFEPEVVVAGEPVTAVIRLNGPVPARGALLRHDSGDAFGSPNHILLQGGATGWRGTFPTAVPANLSETTTYPVEFGLAQSVGSPYYLGTDFTVVAALRLSPPPAGVAMPTLVSITSSVASLQHGSSATGTVRLDRVAPVGGVAVALQSEFRIGAKEPVFLVPDSIVVPAGQREARFTFTANAGEGDAQNASPLPVPGELRFPQIYAFLRLPNSVAVATTRAPAPTLRGVRVETDTLGRPTALVAQWDRPDIYPVSRSTLSVRSTNTAVIANAVGVSRPTESTARIPLTVSDVPSVTFVDLFYRAGAGSSERLLRVRVPPLPQAAANSGRAVARG